MDEIAMIADRIAPGAYFEKVGRMVLLESDDCDITHWRPLPDPPGGEASDAT